MSHEHDDAFYQGLLRLAFEADPEYLAGANELAKYHRAADDGAPDSPSADGAANARESTDSELVDRLMEKVRARIARATHDDGRTNELSRYDEPVAMPYLTVAAADGYVTVLAPKHAPLYRLLDTFIIDDCEYHFLEYDATVWVRPPPVSATILRIDQRGYFIRAQESYSKIEGLPPDVICRVIEDLKIDATSHKVAFT